MAKNHNLFVGGAATRNADYGIFPSVPANVSFASHKQGGGSGGLQRDLQFGYGPGQNSPLDPGLNHYMTTHVFAAGDIINAILIPTNCLLTGVLVEVLNAGPAGMTADILMTNTAGGAVAYDEAGLVTDGLVTVAAAVSLAAKSKAYYVPEDAVTFAALAPAGFAARRPSWASRGRPSCPARR